MNKKYNFFYYWGVRLLVLFIVFDGLRDALIFSKWISYFKEFTTFLLMLYVLAKSVLYHSDIRIPKSLLYFNHLFFFFFLLIFFPYAFLSDKFGGAVITHSYLMYYKMLQFFFLVNIFSFYEKMSGDHYKNLLLFFLSALMIYILITPILYATSPWFLKSHFKQYGRIGIGYPTMDAEVMIMGLILVLFIFQFSFYKGFLYIALLFLGILMQNTGTGYVSLFFVIGAYLLSRKKKNSSAFFFAVLISSLFLFCVYIFWFDVLNKQFALLFRKLQGLLQPSSSISISIRHTQYLTAKSFIKNTLDALVGVGLNIYIENQYTFFKIAFGLVGYLGFLIFLGINFICGFLIRKRDSYILLFSTIIFGLTSYTLLSLYLFPIEGVYALFIGFSFMQLQTRNKEVL